MQIPDILIPGINVKSNTLDVLLTGIGLRFKQLSKTSDEFKELLEDRSFSIQIVSQEGVARHYEVNHGEFSQKYGYTTSPDLTMTFVDNETAVKIFTKGSPTAFMSAIQDKELTMEGDYSLLMWFGKAANFVVPEIPETVKDIYNTAKPIADKAQPYAEMALPIIKSTFKKLKSFRK